MLDAASMGVILSQYGHASAFQRFHMRSRLRLCPYDALPRHLTGAGSILDVGCGFGHLAWYLAAARPDLRYYGSDIDDRKVNLALGCPVPTQGLRPQFRLGDAVRIPDWPEYFGNIALLDVLYLLPWEAQVRMLEWGLAKLAPAEGSALVIKSMEAPRGASGLRALAEEWVMVSLLKRTVSSGTLRGARPAEDYAAFAKERGFHSEVQDLGTFNPSYIISIRR